MKTTALLFLTLSARILMSQQIFFVAAASEDGGIPRLNYDRSSGNITSLAFNPLPGCGYLVLSPDRKHLYAAVSSSAKYEKDGELAAFAVDADGRLTYLNSLPSGGLSCCHLTLAGKFIYTANYTGGTLAEFALAEDGSLASRTQLIPHEGKSVTARQKTAHPHFVSLTPDGKWLAVVDLGCDGTFFYKFDPERGIDKASASLSPAATPGDGPRHLIFNAAGNIAYVANELANSVTACHYADGALKPFQSLTTLPADFSAANTVAAIRLSHDGKQLYCSNRGHDSIARYNIASDGRLETAGHLPAIGQGPRDFMALDKAGLIAVGNEGSNTLDLLNHNPDGSWQKAASLSIMSRPICILPWQ